MEGEDITARGVWSQEISETGFYSGALITERQWTPGRGKRVRKTLTVFSCLNFEPRQSAAFLFGFHDSNCLAVHVEKAVSLSKTGLHGKFTDGDAPPRI